MLINDCYVPPTSSGFNYTNTVLGAIFAISGLPKIPGGIFEYFQKPMEEVGIFLFYDIHNMFYLSPIILSKLFS
jgi:hypothetical protein